LVFEKIENPVVNLEILTILSGYLVTFHKCGFRGGDFLAGGPVEQITYSCSTHGRVFTGVYSCTRVLDLVCVHTRVECVYTAVVSLHMTFLIRQPESQAHLEAHPCNPKCKRL
jgi:hypothetical protein